MCPHGLRHRPPRQHRDLALYNTVRPVQVRCLGKRRATARPLCKRVAAEAHSTRRRRRGRRHHSSSSRAGANYSSAPYRLAPQTEHSAPPTLTQPTPGAYAGDEATSDPANAASAPRLARPRRFGAQVRLIALLLHTHTHHHHHLAGCNRCCRNGPCFPNAVVALGPGATSRTLQLDVSRAQ